jgi:8-oxo-dGTP diphosphatase
MSKEYVLGFLFSEDRKNVVLLRKNKPNYQKGKMNGLGGKVEKVDGTFETAMTREFQEEAGVVVTDWKRFATVYNDDFYIAVFKSFGDISNVRTMEDEIVSVVRLSNLHLFGEIMPNLKALLEVALNDDIRHADFVHK